MIGSVQFETDRLIQKLRAIQPEMKKGMKTLTKDAGKLAVRKAVEMTPPGWAGMESSKAKARGEKKLTGDMRRVYPSASYVYSTIKNAGAAAAFWFLIKSRRAKDFNEAMKIVRTQSYNTLIKDARIVDVPDPAIHQSLRIRGTIKKRQGAAQIIVRENKLESLIKTNKRNVGIWAAGWMPAVEKLKIGRVAAWIRRHAGKGRGRCDFKESGDRFEIEIANTTGYGNLARIVPYAIAAARAGMDAQFKVIKAKALAKAGFNRAPGAQVRAA